MQQYHSAAEIPGRLAPYGWTSAVQDVFQSTAGPSDVLARVVRVDRNGCVVVTARHEHRCRVLEGSEPPVTGDWVAIQLVAGASPVVLRNLPRSTVVERTNAAGTGSQTLVANVDAMFVLHGVDRPHRVGRLERLSILSWEAGIEPVIVLTKVDLDGTPAATITVSGAIREIQRVIHAIDVVPASAVTGEGIEALRAVLQPRRTVGVVGESGAGKSSLVNHLAGAEVQATQATRSGDHKGRHTTTSRELVPIPTGGVMVDTPGLRSIAMTPAHGGLARSYADLEKLAVGCRFRDCSHEVEPGCAVRAAIEAGDLPESRWAAYRKLHREMAYERRRAEQRARRTAARGARRRPRSVPDDDEW